MNQESWTIRTSDLTVFAKIVELLGPLALVINRRRLYISVDTLPADILSKVLALGGQPSKDVQYDLEADELDLRMTKSTGAATEFAEFADKFIKDLPANNFVDKFLEVFHASPEEMSKRIKELAPKSDADGRIIIPASEVKNIDAMITSSKQNCSLVYGPMGQYCAKCGEHVEHPCHSVSIKEQLESETLAKAFRETEGVREIGPGVYAVELGVGAGVGTTGGNAGPSLQGLQGPAVAAGASEKEHRFSDKEQSSKIRDFVDGFKRFVGSALLFRKVDPEAMNNASNAKLAGFLTAFIVLASSVLITTGYIFSITVAESKKFEVERKSYKGQ